MDTTQTLPVGQHWESGEDVHGSHTSQRAASLKAVVCVNVHECFCAFGAYASAMSCAVFAQPVSPSRNVPVQSKQAKSVLVSKMLHEICVMNIT